MKTGDLLVQFDSQEQDKTALDKKAEYEELLQQIKQKRAEQESARVKDDSELAQARNAVKKFELEILKNEMLSRVLAEKNNQDLGGGPVEGRHARRGVPAEADGGRTPSFGSSRSSATAPRRRWTTRSRTRAAWS